MSKFESILLNFYRGQGTDAQGRLLKDIWAWNDDKLEDVHDFIQWLFPLSVPSQFNPDAPLLTEGDIAAFKSEAVLQANLIHSFKRILCFLGLLSTEDGKVVECDSFPTRSADVWEVPNHNWLRITRILRSLTLLGMEAEAQALFDRLAAYYQSRRFPISADTFRYWTNALKTGSDQSTVFRDNSEATDYHEITH